METGMASRPWLVLMQEGGRKDPAAVSQGLPDLPKGSAELMARRTPSQGGRRDRVERTGEGSGVVGIPSVDHVKPLAKGGKHSWRNVVLAHRICNTLKSDREPEQLRL